MTVTQPAAEPAARPEPDDSSLKAAVNDVKTDVSRLVAEQLAIAKIEMKREGTKLGMGGGMLATALFAVYMVLMFGTLAGVYGLGHLLGNGWAALIVAGVWALVAAITALVGRAVLRKVSGPQQSIAAFKENLEWVRTLKK